MVHVYTASFNLHCVSPRTVPSIIHMHGMCSLKLFYLYSRTPLRVSGWILGISVLPKQATSDWKANTLPPEPKSLPSAFWICNTASCDSPVRPVWIHTQQACKVCVGRFTLIISPFSLLSLQETLWSAVQASNAVFPEDILTWSDGAGKETTDL